MWMKTGGPGPGAVSGFESFAEERGHGSVECWGVATVNGVGSRRRERCWDVGILIIYRLNGIACMIRRCQKTRSVKGFTWDTKLRMPTVFGSLWVLYHDDMTYRA